MFKNKAMIILGVFENDKNQPLEYLTQEKAVLTTIFEALQKKYTSLSYRLRSNGGVEEIIKVINENREELIWFHFSGHHDEGIGIRMNDGSLQSLANSLLNCPNLKGVFINGCSSKETLEDLLEDIPICIGTVEPVYDSIAFKFSELFYSEILRATDWLDFKTLHAIFNNTLPTTYDIVNTIPRLNGTERGGGSPEDFKNNFYFISKNNTIREEKFNSGVLFYSKKINTYNNEGGLISHLENRIENFNINYWKEPPAIIRRILKPLIAPGIGLSFKQIGIGRYNLIKEYFFAYIDICRYSILSILWEEIENNKVKASKTKILELFTSVNNFDSDKIKTLIELCKEVIINHGNKDEIEFVKELPTSLTYLKESINYVNGPNNFNEPSEKVLWETELLLQKIIVSSQFLNSYRLQSIFSKYYKRNRSSKKVKYEIDYRYATGNLLTEKEDDIGFEFAHNHSIYICEEYGQKKILINLSPFYFDENSSDQSATKIAFYVLDSYEEINNEYRFKEIPESINQEEVLEKIISEKPRKSEPLKYKDLSEQLNYLIKLLKN